MPALAHRGPLHCSNGRNNGKERGGGKKIIDAKMVKMRLFSLSLAILKQVPRGAENAQGRGARVATMLLGISSGNVHFLHFKKGAEIDISLWGFVRGRPVGRAGSNRFFTNISQEHATRAKKIDRKIRIEPPLIITTIRALCVYHAT